ncbi:leucyl aminopeptidase [Corynebacterium variabile]|uniref:leucyl aminopeptidase n=2 Tax=Corynebacterium variabile TaxID=1727 RepID=UPI0028A8B09F|nr:leucyl aminopeptidase [Corynebacterium variabile]
MTSGIQSIVPTIAHGTVPGLHLSTDDNLPGTDVLVVPVVAGTSGPELPVSHRLGEAAQVELWKSAVETGVAGTAGETGLLPVPDGVAASRVLTVGLGPADGADGPDAETVRQAAGAASRALEDLAGEVSNDGLTAVSLLGDLTDVAGCTAAAVEGHALGGYRYSGRRHPTGTGHLRAVTVIAPDSPETPEVFAHACTVVEAVTCARDLVNAPASELTPETYALIIADLGGRSGVETEILDEDELAGQGFGGLLAVGRGSARPPRLVRMHYRPEASHSRHVALVGKGVTFDTGGISLKKAPGMDTMISDMGGSAAMVATVLAAAELELPVAVTATIPLVENMPDGDALRPGDIVQHYGGSTSEILNTDAEGRLILADALARAAEDAPDLLVEAATLTGAQVSTLGDRITAVMGTPSLRDRIVAHGRQTGEDAWPMPLPAEIARDIRSDVADVRNTGTTRWGGMAAAGQYLAHVIPEGLDWVHLDIAGPAYNTGNARGYTPKRGTGAPVRTLIAFLEDVAASD